MSSERAQSAEKDAMCRYGTHAPVGCPARVFALRGTTPPTCPVPPVSDGGGDDA